MPKLTDDELYAVANEISSNCMSWDEDSEGNQIEYLDSFHTQQELIKLQERILS